ncbi:uncharacterized protein LOC128391271 [Panonychus citri]|uniref:uncharacterized protein LOC128391271 n=1 Tax=Panonychus citri TaxID=50023 RepID=UPI002307DD79|nr:uncharacterized protein LOC128391271 [Panonychus citri]
MDKFVELVENWVKLSKDFDHLISPTLIENFTETVKTFKEKSIDCDSKRKIIQVLLQFMYQSLQVLVENGAIKNGSLLEQFEKSVNDYMNCELEYEHRQAIVALNTENQLECHICGAVSTKYAKLKRHYLKVHKLSGDVLNCKKMKLS